MRIDSGFLSLRFLNKEALKPSNKNKFLSTREDRKCFRTFELLHDKTNKMTCVLSKDSDQPEHPPSLIRVFTVRMKKHWALNYLFSTLWRLWSDWEDAQADLSLCWVHVILLVLSCGGSSSFQTPLTAASLAWLPEDLIREYSWQISHDCACSHVYKRYV